MHSRTSTLLLGALLAPFSAGLPAQDASVQEAVAQIERGLDYKAHDPQNLRMDLYYPAAAAPEDGWPVVVLVNGSGTRAAKDHEQCRAWGRRLTDQGLAAISYESASGQEAEDLGDLFWVIRRNAEALEMDAARIGVLACATHVPVAQDVVLGGRPEGVAAAAFLYGPLVAGKHRLDLPTLVVTAAEDAVATTQAMGSFTSAAATSNAPVTYMNCAHSGAFFDLHAGDSAEARAATQTIVSWMEAQLRAEAEAPAPDIAGGTDLSELLRSANQSFEQGRWADASARFSQALELDPANGAAAFNLGFAEHMQGNYQRSARLWARSAELDFRPEVSLYNIACAKARLGELDQGVEYLARAVDAGFSDLEQIRTDPDMDPLRDHAGYQAALRGEVAESPPERPVGELLDEANRAFQAQDWEAAAAGYAAVLEQVPDHGSATFNRGYALYAQGRHQEGIPFFERCVELGVSVPIAQYNLACGHARLGETEAAFEWLYTSLNNDFPRTDLLGTDPDLDSLREDPRFERILAGDYEQLEPAGEEPGEAPVDPNALQQQALAAFQHQDWPTALTHFDRLREVDPDNGAWDFQAGYARYMLGQYATGLDCFEEALEAGFQPSTTMYNLACGHSRTGEEQEAFTWLAKSIQNGFSNFDLMRSDPDLENLRKDERWATVLKLIEDR